ncbi:MAG: hypothetical protein RJA44_1788 [Pseudomonadota bacterium]|jgi:hypothetical protein
MSYRISALFFSLLMLPWLARAETLVVSEEIRQQVSQIVAGSACAAHRWKSQGRAPIGYVKGMALVYAKSYCEQLQDRELASRVLAAPLGDARRDALSHYGLDIDAPAEALRSVYALGIGLGMLESTGRATAGRNLRVRHPSEFHAEAGLFQTNHGSSRLSSWFGTLDRAYEAAPQNCLAEVFAEGVSATTPAVLGHGAGARYQQRVRNCPGLATEYAMLLLRQHRSHFGPINRRKAQIVPACSAMLSEVEQAVREYCQH